MVQGRFARGRRALTGAAVVALAGWLVTCASQPATSPRQASSDPAAAAAAAPPSGAAAPTATPVAPKPFVFAATTAASISSLPLWMGLASGYFVEEGLDLSILLAGGSASLAALLSGDAHASAAGETGVRAAYQGGPFVVVAVPISRPSYYIYTQPDIASLQQLKGQSIAITVVGTSPHVLAMRLLRQLDGWADPAREARWVPAGNQRVEVLAAGAVQAGVLGSPEDLVADRLGMRKHLDFSEHLTLPVGSVNVTNRYLDENRDDVRRFLRGHLKGLRRAHADAAFATQVIQERVELPAETARALYQSEMPKFTMDNTLPESALALSLEINRETLEGVVRELDTRDAYDFAVANQVARELESSGWRP
jgi:ABC-type nitrate/sulfonate/bicarbonate transport system substrate-binding protein